MVTQKIDMKTERTNEMKSVLKDVSEHWNIAILYVGEADKEYGFSGSAGGFNLLRVKSLTNILEAVKTQTIDDLLKYLKK